MFLRPCGCVDNGVAFRVFGNVERNVAESHLAVAKKCLLTEAIRLSIIIH